MAVGVIGFLMSNRLDGSYHPTALIPALIGVLILVCGVLAIKPSWRKHAMHFAAMLGLIGAIMPIVLFVKMLINGPFDGLKAFSFLATAALCVLFVVMSVRSFIAARKARKAAAKLAV
jgi:hypothetical protein